MLLIVILIAASQVFVIYTGVRQEHRAGLRWNWMKFVFSLAFAGLEARLIIVPLISIDQHSRLFAPVAIAAGVVALVNFVWFIVVCSRWKLPATAP